MTISEQTLPQASGEIDRIIDRGVAVYVRSLNPQAARVPLVMVHGVGLSGRYFLPAARLLSVHHPVFVLDLPGYGESPKPDGVLDVPQHADALAAWTEQKGLRPVFVANSFGCQVVADLAMRYPALTQGLVLASPTIDPALHSARQQLSRLLLDSLLEKRALRKLAIQDVRATGIRRVVRTMLLSLDDRIEDKLPHVSAPVLVLSGSRDPLMSTGWAETLLALLPRGSFTQLEGATHGLNFHSPEAFVEAIGHFVGSSIEAAATKE